MTEPKEEGVSLPADWEPQNGYVMSVGPGREPGEVMAIISDGSPQRGDENVVILTLETFDMGDDEDALRAKIKEWFDLAIQTKPWVTRN